MKLREVMGDEYTKHRVYFKDPADVEKLLGLNQPAIRVGRTMEVDAAKALKDRIYALSTWPKHDKEVNRYYLEVGDPWNPELQPLVDVHLTYKHR